MANGGMYGEGEEEKKYSWLEKKIVTKAKKGHVHQTPGARFIRTNSIVKNGKVMGSKGWLRIVGRNKQKERRHVQVPLLLVKIQGYYSIRSS